MEKKIRNFFLHVESISHIFFEKICIVRTCRLDSCVYTYLKINIYQKENVHTKKTFNEKKIRAAFVLSCIQTCCLAPVDCMLWGGFD